MYMLELFLSIESLIMILLLVAFYIMGERKVLSYIQLRKGPNKVGIVGLLQSFADFIKLLSKSKLGEFSFRSWFSLLGCVILVSCSLSMVVIYSLINSNMCSNWILLYLLVVCSVLSYSTLLIGWCSWSKYGLISSIRVSFSSVMFEMILMCIIILFGLMYGSYGNPDINSIMIFVVPLVYIIWLIVLLSESNRTPCDYVESESELVSGISVEYSSIFFLIIFACEYLIMFIFSWVSFTIFWSINEMLIVMNLMLFIMMRGSFPRLRFDVFVSVIWEYCVMVILIYLICLFSIL
ncbi:NAD1 (mitochondrion) [Schistosoma bovis]|uniref:NADH-ubiquinone oxidoreductase chain 1 n=1 Tax=Schistosoma bovis TaxID=6184 RepID=A0A430PWS5_SCHBO|nr:NADH dehydrogenase subunit 1 [Schistosoma bovis]RTG79924.1 NAD1 [Schistosoma bovis]